MKDPRVDKIVQIINRVTKGPSALHEPVFRGKENEYSRECIDSGWVSSVGPFVDRFERELAQYTGAGFAVATVNGTAALHAALLLVGVQSQDEVMIPALSFVATANAVAYCGATPHFVDVSENTLGLDVDVLAKHLHDTLEPVSNEWRNKKTGHRMAAIVPMHTFGHACDIEAICEVANRYGLPVVEDAAESLGSLYNGRHTGTFGRLGILSFNGNKIVTSGGGGAILTDDAVLAKRAKHITTTAKIPHRWAFEHDTLGFNYRMPNINAAVGCAQLEQLPQFLRIKRENAMRYKVAFDLHPGVDFVCEREGCYSNYWLNSIRLKSESQALRDEILEATNAVGVMTRPCWTPLNQLSMYADCPKSSLRTTNLLFDQLINLPSGVGIGRKQSEN